MCANGGPVGSHAPLRGRQSARCSVGKVAGGQHVGLTARLARLCTSIFRLRTELSVILTEKQMLLGWGGGNRPPSFLINCVIITPQWFSATAN